MKGLVNTSPASVKQAQRAERGCEGVGSSGQRRPSQALDQVIRLKTEESVGNKCVFLANSCIIGQIAITSHLANDRL